MTDNADGPEPDQTGQDTMDTAEAAVWSAGNRLALTRALTLLVLTVPVVVLVLVGASAGMAVTLSAGGWARRLTLIYLAMVLGCVLGICRSRTPRERRAPGVAEFTDRTAWLYRAVTAPLGTLCAVLLVRMGLSWGWAVGAALVGWAALDLSLLATYRARVTLYRLLRLATPRTPS